MVRVDSALDLLAEGFAVVRSAGSQVADHTLPALQIAGRSHRRVLPVVSAQNFKNWYLCLVCIGYIALYDTMDTPDTRSTFAKTAPCYELSLRYTRSFYEPTGLRIELRLPITKYYIDYEELFCCNP